jgi:PAS domain S-box-containing protein
MNQENTKPGSVASNDAKLSEKTGQQVDSPAGTDQRSPGEIPGLSLTNDQIRAILDISSDGFWIINNQRKFVEANRSFCKRVGYTIAELREMTLDEIDGELTDEQRAVIMRQVVEAGGARFETRHRSKDGRMLDVEISVTFHSTSGGLLYCFGRDISERRRAQAALKEAEEKYRTILESMDSGYYEVDVQGNMIFHNPALRNFLGLEENELQGLNFSQFMDKEEAGRVRLIFGEVYESGNPSGDFYWRFLGKNGESTYSAASVYPIRDSLGAIVGFRGTVRDITAMKEAKDAADAANRSKSVFLANMSHEIRTPMNAILGFAQLMQRDPSLTPQSREHLDIINRSGEHLLATINDILEMSKIEAGRSIFVPTPFDMHSLLYDLERMFRLRTDSKNLRFLVEKVGEVPRWVITDEGKLRQILINLLGNAVKFTDEGGISLRIGGKAANDDTVNLQFEMEDTGPGMAEDEIGRLFQAFEQTSSGLKSGGTGLGLALSRGFAELMGGTMSVTSKVGKGSIFRFNIPVRESREEHAATQEAKQRVLRLRPGQDEIRVLIADDRETNRQLLSQMLASTGFVTREAVNGAEAVQAVLEWKPRIVLMDMAMPVMDGYDATRKIRESPDSGDIAIVAVTASAFEEDKQRILAAGANDYLSKPFKEAELFEIIGRLTGAQYLYEEIGGRDNTSSPPEDTALLEKVVASLPADLVNRMLSAVESADLDLLNELTLQLVADHPVPAQKIQEMAARYEYERLIKLFS